ncbi:substrate-binding domain-containing protein [Aquihabitans sp. McL0605]|uniref:substrate-binding domain-containing protein n=1 Tax=Aquihabitans sp. McL0605 TaxID=3415671 RepID=UPI003CF5BED0
MIRARLLGAVLATAIVASIATAAPRAEATGTLVNGAGSSYVALAMQQWVTDASAQGLRINFTPTGSPDGVQRYVGTQVNFAATEAEFSSFGTTSVPRGYQYVPDVAGAVAVMYNLHDRAGRKVDYLHLSQKTIARIFLGDISSWADPAISAENAGFVFPDKPINVVFRSGQSGTTGLFYDFVKHADPSLFASWAARTDAPTNVRILEMPPGFAPKTQGLATSDQIAQFVASDAGQWSISYDEFGYAKTYGAPAAWVQNGAGKWVLPYAENISAALESAKLKPDLSQELSGVFASTNPLAYPVSAYSYVVTQCVPSADRATCRGKYPDQGVIDTLTPWFKYIACEGQVPMARIGYSPLPPNLSQEIINSIARLTGTPQPLELTAQNCVNPRFHGSLGAGAGSPADPFDQLPGGACAASGCNPGGGGGTAAPQGSAAAADDGGNPSSGGAVTDGGAALRKIAAADAARVATADAASGKAAAGSKTAAGATDWLPADPKPYSGTDSGHLPVAPAAVLLATLLVPALVVILRRRRAVP